MNPLPAWRALGAVAAVAAALALRWSSVASWPTGSAGQEAARVRLSWSARPERVEQCRQLSDAELERLPEHMRLRTSCEGHSARYLLVVVVDGQRVALDTLRGGGLRHDRPIHVFGESTVEPGQRRLLVVVTRVEEGGLGTLPDSAREQADVADTILLGRAARERDERGRRASEAIPSRLVLDTLLTLAPRRVVLVIFDDNTRQLLARTEP